MTITEQQERGFFQAATGKDIHSRVARKGYLMDGAVKAADLDLAKAYPDLNCQSSFHRSPAETASADRYYGRSYHPSFTFLGHTFAEADMSAEQKQAYDKAWNEETDRKDWGEPRGRCSGESNDYDEHNTHFGLK